WTALALAGLAVVAMVGCKPRREGAAAALMQRPPAMVTVAAAATRDVPIYLDRIGTILSMEIVSIVPQVGGRILAAHVEDGAFVEKGQLLFEIDPRPFQAALASAEAALAQSKAERDWAQIELNRVTWLRSQDSATQFEFDQKQVGLSVALAKIEAAEAAVAAARLDVEYSRIYSPISGRAGARLVHPGNVVRANESPLLVIQQLDPIYVEFTINENDLNTVRKHLASRGQDISGGLTVEVDVPANQGALAAAVGGFPGPASRPSASPGPNGAPPTTASATHPAHRPEGPRRGMLTFMDNTVQAGAGTVRLRATLPNADNYFWPGQFVNVRLILTTQKDAVLVPAAAQQIGQQGSFVYVVGPDGKATIRPIVPGQRHGDAIVVQNGLAAGERVVVTGQMAIMPGAPVVVINEGSGPPGPPGGGIHAAALSR
ncbi:MAG: efflux RND transporter periplasmic adaptor subunit, partial [Phycisphaerae bacterium]